MEHFALTAKKFSLKASWTWPIWKETESRNCFSKIINLHMPLLCSLKINCCYRGAVLYKPRCITGTQYIQESSCNTVSIMWALHLTEISQYGRNIVRNPQFWSSHMPWGVQIWDWVSTILCKAVWSTSPGATPQGGGLGNSLCFPVFSVSSCVKQEY